MPDLSKTIEGKKYMWDGYLYEIEDEAKEIESKYKISDFETVLLREDGKYLVYNRKIVKDIVIDGGQ